MEKHYFSFGQTHTHRYVNMGKAVTLDCDSIVQINAADGEIARQKMFDVFGKKWSFQYSEDRVDLTYFPRGVVLELTCE